MSPRTFVLGVSVAFNVFLLALVATQAWHAPAPSVPGSPIDRLAAALPSDDAARFRAAIAARRPEFQPARDAVSAAHRDVAAAIAREPFDRDALATALTRWQESWRGFTARFDQAFLDAAGAISDDGRARLAQAALDEDARRRARDNRP